MSKTRYQRALERLLRFARRDVKRREKGFTIDDVKRASQKLLAYSKQEEGSSDTR